MISARLLVVLLLVVAASAPAASAAGSALPKNDSLLFVVQSEGGTLTPLPGARGARFELTLRGVPSHAVWFSDRPARDTGSLLSSRLAGSAWRALGFRTDPPNAVVSLGEGRAGMDTVALELSRPRWELGGAGPAARGRGGARSRGGRAVATGGVLHFRARLLRTVTSGLAHHAGRLDARLPRRFGAAALFIDNGYAQVQTCSEVANLDLYPQAIQPYGAIPADGATVPVNGNQVLASLIGFGWGAQLPTSFNIPNVTAPAAAAALRWQLCTYGSYPVTSSGPSSSGALCNVGELGLTAMQNQRAGWIPADGRAVAAGDAPLLAAALGARFGNGSGGFLVPNVAAPPGLRWDVCAAGIAWSPPPAQPPASGTCTIGQMGLFATAALPANWAPADGRLLQISQYMPLFALIDAAYGGNGYQTFATPDVAAPVAGTQWAICTQGVYSNT